MNCPHCNQELSANFPGPSCPFCGADLSIPKANQPALDANGLAPVKVSWLIFFTVFLLPVVLTTLSAATKLGQGQDLPVGIGLFGGGVAGFACGVMLALRSGRTIGVRVLLSVLLGGALAVACITACCIGCGVGGYQLNLH